MNTQPTPTLTTLTSAPLLSPSVGDTPQEPIILGTTQIPPVELTIYTAYRTDGAGNVLGYYEAHTPPPADTANLKFVECDPSVYPPIYISPAQTLAAAVSAANILLMKTDTALKRINEGITLGLTQATAADVVAYVTFIRALRAWVKSPSGAAPTEPPYPAGT